MDLDEINSELDMEFFFERESLPYRMTRGSSGMQINARHCPSCGDARWRTYFGIENGRGNCFVCGESWNCVSFLREHYDVPWREVVRIGAEILREQGWRPKRMVAAAVEPGEVKLPYSYELPLEDGSNLAYLETRNVTGELARYFGLRWCEYGWWLCKDDDGAPMQQGFNDRIIIPVYDLNGELKTFQGRDLTGKSERKYLFPKGLPGTGRFLYNGQNVQATKEIAVGEGAFDVIALKIALDEEPQLRHVVPVGTFGKHLSVGAGNGSDQLGAFMRLKATGVERVTIMWDGGEKELIAALNAARLLSRCGLTARIALLPLGKDPNEITPHAARRCYYEAVTWTPALDIRWRLKNPYSARSCMRDNSSQH